MKTTTSILTFVLLIILSLSAYSQSAQERVRMALQEIIKEKVRNVDAGSVIIEKNQKENLELRSTREYKITNNNNVDISEGEPMIAVDVNNPQYMCLSYMRNSSIGLEMPIYYSLDGGLNWSLSDFLIDDAINDHEAINDGFLLGGGDPVLLYDNDHKLYYSWITFTFGLSGIKLATWYAISNDHGKTFTVNKDQAFIALGKLESLQSVEIENYGNGILDRQWLAIDRSNGPHRGNIYCSGLHIPRPDANKNIGIGMLRKLATSDTFDTKIKIINDQPNLQFANIAVDNFGFLHVVYASTNNDGVFHQVSKDGGNSFSEVHKISSSSYLMNGTKNIQLRENPMPMIAIDNTNNQLFVSWTDYQRSNVQAYYSSSKDHGKTWTEKSSIGALKNIDEQSFMPALSTNEKGDLSFSWFQVTERNRSHFYTAVKEKNSINPLDPITISNKTTQFLPYLSKQDIFFGDYLNSVMVGCKTFVVFSDGRDNLGAKMYLGVTDYCDETSSIYTLSAQDSYFQLQSIFPNPARESINLTINSTQGQEVDIAWYGLNGKKLTKEIKINIKPGAASYNLVIPKNVVSGQVLNLQLSTNSYKTARKIIIK